MQLFLKASRIILQILLWKGDKKGNYIQWRLLHIYLPAVIMALKQDFWSIRGQRTYFAAGRSCLNVSMHNTNAIPVAMGTMKAPVAEGTPKNIQNYII